jgi:FkbM family methyltransferase
MDKDLPVVERLPWYVRFAANRLRAGKRGGNFLLRNMRRAGMLDKCIALPISDSERVYVPLYWMYVWHSDSLATYEEAAVAKFSAAVAAMGAPSVFVDCGADVGIFSRAVLARAKNVERLIAFEPNERSYSLLRRNTEKLAIRADVLCAGVLDEPGRGTLNADRYKSHAGFVQHSDSGGTKLYTVDQMEIPADHGLAMKIDVEGGELAVLRGAAKTIRAARRMVVQFEAHPEVTARTGVDAVECLRFLTSLRDCSWSVAERPDARIALDRPLFEQTHAESNCNVIVVSPR